MKVVFKWDKINIVTTALVLGVTALIIPLIFSCSSREIIIAITILLLVLFFIGLSPLYLKADKEKLIIKRIAGNVSIPYETIQSIEILRNFSLWQALRIGSAGFFGYTGIWYHRKIGWFILYATENKSFVFVKTNDKKYVIGCREPEQFISYVEKKKNYAR